jgi:hypothetical protein
MAEVKKHCWTCKHEQEQPEAEPCRTCVDESDPALKCTQFGRWEPKDQAEKDGE